MVITYKEGEDLILLMPKDALPNGMTIEEFTDWFQKNKEKLTFIVANDTKVLRTYVEIGQEIISGVRELLEKQKEQKSIEDVAKEVTKDKESAIKFLKSAGIMDENGKLAKIYTSEREQEQPEVDLEKEISNWMVEMDCKYALLTTDWVDRLIIDTAKHFYELGLNAKKEA